MQSAFLTLLPTLSLASAPGSAPASQDAAALLAEQRAGLGAPAALAAIRVLESHGKLAFQGFPSEGAYIEILAPDGGARLEALFEGIPPALRCSNGELFWMTGTGGVEIKQGWSAAADVRLFALGRHRDWREVYARAEYVGEASVGERACHELQLVPKSPTELGIEAVPGEEVPAPDTWWLERDSKELVRVALYATVSGAGWQRLVLDYSDWRATDGVRFPYRSRMAFGPPEHELVIDFTRQTLDLDAELRADRLQPDEPIFRELARARSSAARPDPGFVLQQRKPVQTAVVRVRCKRESIQQQLPLLLPEVMAYLQRERQAPVGPPFARYQSADGELELEAGIPVAQAIPGNGRVVPASLPGGDVVSGMHVGPYQELPRTHDALAQWLAKASLVPEGGPWEVYWTDPGLERDPSKWRTEIFQAVSARPAGAAGAPVNADDLRRFEILVGKWRVEGDIAGTVEFEWLEGGHFLLQRFDLLHEGREIRGIELIGHERPFGADAASPEIRSRVYDNAGNTLDYVWEIGAGTLTIWGGEKGSPVSYQGEFSADGNTLAGGWTWPGGGYESSMTRVVEPGTPAKQARRAN